MREEKLDLINFFEGEDVQRSNEDSEISEVDSSYFNKVCVNITNMTNSSINLGNNVIGPSQSINPNATTSSTRSATNKKAKNGKNLSKKIKQKKATVKVTFPAMFKKRA